MLWVLGAIGVLALLEMLGQAMATMNPNPSIVPIMPAPPKTVWQPIPQGQDIQLAAGFYAVVALVKNSHSEAEVRSLLAQRGLTVTDYKDPADPSGFDVPSGYRIVAAMAQSSGGGGSIPWGLPGPLAWVDKTKVLKAWKAVSA